MKEQILTLLRTVDKMSAKELRTHLNIRQVKFYNIMMELEDANLIECWHEECCIDGNTIRKYYYRVKE